MKRSQNDDLKLAGVVHDLNNVLQTFIDAADQLADDPRWTDLSAALLRNVERGRAITRALDATRGAKPASLAEVVERAIAFVEDAQAARATGSGKTNNGAGSRVESPKVRFECRVEGDLLVGGNGAGGPWAWERVFINLFLNSMRAMPGGGTITVEAAKVEAAEQDGEVGRTMMIRVADEGSGIPEEIAGRLFEPNVSTHGSSGLGLHIVRTIVTEDGGTVEAANRAGARGAEFVISVPVNQGRKSRKSQSATA